VSWWSRVFSRGRSQKSLRRFTPERAKAASRGGQREPLPQSAEKLAVAVAAGAAACLLIGTGLGLDTAGWMGLLALTVVGEVIFVRYLVDFRRKALDSVARVTATGVMLMMPLALLRLLDLFGSLEYLPFLPLSLFGLVLSIAWGRALALECTLFSASLLGVYVLAHPGVPGSAAGLVISVVGGISACLAASHLRRRSAVVRIGAISGLVQVVVAGSLFLLNPDVFGAGNALWPFVVLAVEGVAVGLLTSGSLFAIEGALGVTTDVSLLELGNTHEQPLLRKLLLEAPGTFHHSYIVGLISEAAAEAVNANALLTRVGSLYHDVGKLNKPNYFIENSRDASTKHKALTPEMSTLIISSHPRDGIEIGKYYGLPKSILDFMPEHHGTSCIEYFYHAACKLRGEEQVNQENFRYPGPKPQSVETAIVMIADAVEAIARQMKEPTQTRIQEMVHEVSMKRLMDRQFDECDITLAKLEKIEGAVVRVLMGIYHTRQTFTKRRPHPLDLSQPAEERRAASDEERSRKSATGLG